MTDQERTSVKVDLALDGGKVIMTPLDEAAKAIFAAILADTPDCRTWLYNGVSYEGTTREAISSLSYGCGGEQRQVTDHHPKGGSMTYTKYFGPYDLRFDLTAATDLDAVDILREFGYFGTRVVVSDTSTPDKITLTSVISCARCGKTEEVSGGFFEWRVCDACATVCEHTYEDGVVQAGGHIAYRPFCQTCGRVKPSDVTPASAFEDALHVVQNTGVTLVVTDTDGQGYTLGPAPKKRLRRWR
jgi:hypothetical protein